MVSAIKSKKYKANVYIESLIGGRVENQDYADAKDSPIGFVIVVCDGMGGLNGGARASYLAVNTVIDDVCKSKRTENQKKVLKNAILHANQVIIEEGEKDSTSSGMGTTLTAVIINRKSATVAHVGDSRVYQLRGKHKIFRTFDHSKVFEMVKQGFMTEEEARISDNSNIITRALGIDKEVTPEITELPFLSGDRFVLCTDGFWGAQPEVDFLDAIGRKGKTIDIINETATNIDLIGIRAGRTHDNLTAAVVDLNFDSELKIEMRRNTKIFIACITIIAIISICFNFYFIHRIKEIKVKNTTEQTTKDCNTQPEVTNTSSTTNINTDTTQSSKNK